MKICKKCIQPDSRPQIYFNEEGICGACLWQEEKKKIDWNSRRTELQEIADWAKNNTKSSYDCVIGVSGGKDSMFQALTARDELGLRCLLVNGEPEGITDIGRDNIENLKQLGFDVISLRPNPKIMKKLVKYDFHKHGNPFKVTEFALWSSAYIMAEKFDIPLIIQGENPALTLGVSKGGLSKGYDALEANKQNTQALGWKEYTEVEDMEEKDLFMFHYDDQNLRKKEIKGIWLQYFLKEWSMNHNAEFSKKYGLKVRPKDFDPASIGTYVPSDVLANRDVLVVVGSDNVSEESYFYTDTTCTNLSAYLKDGNDNFTVGDQSGDYYKVTYNEARFNVMATTSTAESFYESYFSTNNITNQGTAVDLVVGTEYSMSSNGNTYMNLYNVTSTQVQTGDDSTSSQPTAMDTLVMTKQ